MKILLFYICFLLITKVQANNYIIKKSTEDISFLDHEKRQEFELVSFSKRDPFPKISIGSSGSEDIALYLINQMGNKAEDVIKQEVVDWAKKNGYSDKEADKIGEEAKRLVKCMKNTAISLLKWEFNMTKNASCISCKQINSLSNIHTNSSQINGTAAIESLKLLYSIKSTIDDAGKCKFNLECMNTYANDNSCLQSLSSDLVGGSEKI
ncbi:17725_t:CDS:2 [Gigaspora rosea]|nr:17725_t:CDS:2 [Gigaspora rosea]